MRWYRRLVIVEWPNRVIISILSLLAIVIVSIILFFHRDHLQGLVELNYFGAFLIGLVSNVTIVLPMPGLILLFSLSTIFNPVWIGLIGAVGGTIGELSGYIVGCSSVQFIPKKEKYHRVQKWIEKNGFGTIFVFALIPFLSFDLAGITAGVMRFSVSKFVMACFLGKAILYIGIGLACNWGWDFFQSLIN